MLLICYEIIILSATAALAPFFLYLLMVTAGRCRGGPRGPGRFRRRRRRPAS